jgi:hypothetical protein
VPINIASIYLFLHSYLKCSTNHSFKNRTGPAVEPEKTGTGGLAGLLSAQDRPRQRPGKNRSNRPVFARTTEPDDLGRAGRFSAVSRNTPLFNLFLCEK